MVNKIGIEKIGARLYSEFLDTLGNERYTHAEVVKLADSFIRARMIADEYPREKRDLLYDAFFDCDDEKFINDTRNQNAVQRTDLPAH